MKNMIGSALAIAVLASTVVHADPNKSPKKTAAQDGKSDTAIRNTMGFHLLDFVGWNNRDMDVFRHYHTADVKVDMAGQHTDGIEAHVGVVQGMLKQMQEARIVQHSPIIAEGDWTCVVGVAPPVSMVTVAKFRDGAVAEEFILLNKAKPGTPKPQLSGSPLVSIANRANAPRAVTGAEPGWSCVLDKGADGKFYVVLSKGTDQIIYGE